MLKTRTPRGLGIVRTLAATAAFTLTIAGLSVPAEAALGVGDAAPAWEAKEVVGGEATTLKALRGRVILYEFIGTG